MAGRTGAQAAITSGSGVTDLPFPTALAEYIAFVNAAAETVSKPSALWVGEWMEARVIEVVAGCDRFITQTQQDFLQRTPSPRALAEHRRASRMMIGMGRHLLTELLDPDFPNPALARKLELRLWKLNEHHQALHHPLPDTDYADIRSRHFPDEPRA